MTSATARTAWTSMWDRYGWVAMASIWLVFLGFPLLAVWTGDLTPLERALGTALIAIFAVAYVHAFVTALALPDQTPPTRVGLTHLPVLAAGATALIVLIGSAGLGALPFIAALSMFTLPGRWTIAITVGCLAIPIVLPAMGLVDHGAESMSLLVALVTASTGIAHVMDVRERHHQRTQRELHIAAERDRVARDVHDVLGHTLTVVATKSELAARLIDSDPERARGEIDHVHALSREALSEIRAVVAGLRVTQLSDELAAARTALASAGIRADLIGTGNDLDPRHRLTAAWVLREAVTNVVRHSRAEHCLIAISESRLSITDDGEGLEHLHHDGNGIRGLRERVEDSGGTIEIYSPDEGGTRVEARWR